MSRPQSAIAAAAAKPDRILCVSQLGDYALALLWYNATICGDAIRIRDTNPYVQTYLHGLLGEGNCWSRGNSHVLKIGNIELVRDLRAHGFSGRKDLDRVAAPVDPIVSAQVMLECHASMTWQLRHTRRGERYYVPAIDVYGAPEVIQDTIATLASLHLIPVRKPYPLSNQRSMLVSITSQTQLVGIHRYFSALTPRNREFWEAFEAHVSQQSLSDLEYQSRRVKP